MFQKEHIIQKYSDQKVLVFRSSSVQQVRTNEVVEGDMVFINDGDIVPCDMMIVESKKLKVDITTLNIHK